MALGSPFARKSMLSLDRLRSPGFMAGETGVRGCPSALEQEMCTEFNRRMKWKPATTVVQNHPSAVVSLACMCTLALKLLAAMLKLNITESSISEHAQLEAP